MRTFAKPLTTYINPATMNTHHLRAAQSMRTCAKDWHYTCESMQSIADMITLYQDKTAERAPPNGLDRYTINTLRMTQ